MALAAIALVFFQGAGQVLALICLAGSFGLYLRQIRRLVMCLYPLALFRLANERARGQVLELRQDCQGEDLRCRVQITIDPAKAHVPHGPVEVWATIQPHLFARLHPSQPVDDRYAIANPVIVRLNGEAPESGQ